MITPEELRRLPLLADLDTVQLHELALGAADVRLGAGEWLVQEGDTPAFFVLLEGELEVTKSVGGTEHVIGTYHPGDAFGEVPLLLGSAAVANIRALTPARVLRLEALDFHELLAGSDRVASGVLRNMTRRVGNLQRLAVETPPEVTLLVGGLTDLQCFGLREFLSRNQVLFRWLDPGDPALAALVPPEVAGGALPAVVLPDGEVLHRPSIRQVAERVGL